MLVFFFSVLRIFILALILIIVSLTFSKSIILSIFLIVKVNIEKEHSDSISDENVKNFYLPGPLSLPQSQAH